MIPYGHQYIDNQDIKSVLNVLKSDWLTQGPKILDFEKSLAKYCDAKYAVAVCNGTMALHLAYLVAGLSKLDEVITTPNTFVATTNMILAVGAKPVFCDIRNDTFNIDEAKIENFITKKTKAIVPVHFAGHPCEMEVIQKIAKRHKLIVIEDACHALGAQYKGSNIGSCKYSDMTIFSFHPVKSITTAEGGAILTNNKNIYQKLLLLRSHGIEKDKKGFNVMTELGFNYRLSDISASLGLSQLKKLDSFIKKRHEVVRWYKKVLSNVKEIILPKELPRLKSSWHIYVIITKRKKNRIPLYLYLKKHNIGVNFHYPCIYEHPYYKKNGFKKNRCLNAEIYSKTAITLPLHVLIKKEDIKFISKIIRSFFEA